MPSRRSQDRGVGGHLAAAAGVLAARIWLRAAARPVDTFAILGAVAATIVIIVNAAFLQSGSHPAPFFANPAPKPAAAGASVPAPRPKLAEVPLPKPVPQAIAIRRNDPIAELIGPSPRILAVQRVLSEYGYGQIKPSGMLDNATSMAIERFEREHKLPITGRVSDRLVNELSTMTGQPVE